jgi:Uma2 family endonuclease
MSASPTSSPTSSPGGHGPEPGFMALEEFLQRYAQREDPYKYEWNGGLIEQKPRTMNRDQFFIFQNLLRFFMKTSGFTSNGLLMCEVDMFLPFANRTRRADIAYLTGEQMRASRDGKPTVCPFVIEIISQNDQINDLEEKKIEYFDNGVQVLWVVFPKQKKVEIYRSLKDVAICTGEDECSATPVLPDLTLSVHELFM